MNRERSTGRTVFFQTENAIRPFLRASPATSDLWTVGNGFPHPSPSDDKLLYLACAPDIFDHPRNRELRLMDIDGSQSLHGDVAVWRAGDNQCAKLVAERSLFHLCPFCKGVNWVPIKPFVTKPFKPLFRASC